MPDDSDLLVRLRNGDGEALRQIYDRHKHDLLTVATCLLADPPAAEDTLHDVMVTLAASANRLRIRGSLRSYLIACVANRARDEHRRRTRQEVPLEDVEVLSAEAEPIRMAMDGEDSELLRQALLQLPYEQREVITLHLHGDLTFREIARQQEISINTVTSRYRYGIDRLRTILTGVPI
jgi:RNA polymerase sigma-70 factor (ECF subfamily)